MVKLLFLLITLFGYNSFSSGSRDGKREVLEINQEFEDNKGPQSVNCCLDSVVKRFSKGELLSPTSVNVSIEEFQIRISDKKNSSVFRGKEVGKWLGLCDSNSVESYKLLTPAGDYYLLSSPIKQATGLSVNFVNWIVIDVGTNAIVNFRSLSDDTRAFYFDTSANELRCIVFDFSDAFLIQKDFDNVNYLLKVYSLRNGGAVVNAIPSSCRCRSN